MVAASPRPPRPRLLDCCTLCGHVRTIHRYGGGCEGVLTYLDDCSIGHGVLRACYCTRKADEVLLRA